MASWNTWGNPLWGGVSLYLNQQETESFLTADNYATAAASAVAAAGPPPISAAAGVIAAYLALNEQAASNADKGNGICISVPWEALANPIFITISGGPTGNCGSSPANNQQHVNYIDSSGQVHELVFAGSKWSVNNLTQMAGATPYPAAPWSLMDGYETTFNSQFQQHVNFVGAAGHVRELLYTGSNWTTNDLTDLSHAITVPGHGALAGYQSLWNNQQHVNFIDSSGQVHELWFQVGGSWSANNLSELAGATANPAAPWSPLAGYVTPWNNQLHVNYIDVNGHIHELWYSNSGGWQHNDLTELANAEDFPAAGPPLIGGIRGRGSPLASYATLYNNQSHVDYLDSYGHVHELYYSDSWQHNDLTQEAGATEYTAESGSTLDAYETLSNSQQHVNYTDSSGHVHELYYSDSWQHNDLTEAAHATDYTASPGSSLDGYETMFNNQLQQHVNYIDSGGHIHELVYSNGAWIHNDLTNLANAGGATAANLSPLDGYAT